MEPLEHNDTPPEPSRWEGLNRRALWGGLLAAVFLLVVWQGGWLFTWLIMLAAIVMMQEWNGLTEQEGTVWRWAGLFYVAVPCASLIWLDGQRMASNMNAGMQLVLYLVLAVWATDIGAFFAGRQIGGPKLAPSISPHKTWAGLAGGVMAAAAVGGLSYVYTPYPISLGGCLILGAGLAVLAQVSDLFESWLKRRAGVKDSGTLIPGHGGLLDRVDGLIFTAPVFALLVYFSGLMI